MSFLEQIDPEVFSAIQKETDRLEQNLELIASENVVSEAVLEGSRLRYDEQICRRVSGKTVLRRLSVRR